VRLNARSKRNFNYFTGRQLFVQELNQEADALRLQGRSVVSDVHGKIMGGHGARWRAMGHDRRQDFEVRATAARRDKQQTVNDEMDSLMAQIEQVESDIRKHDAEDKPVRFSNVRLTEEEEIDIAALWDHPNYSQTVVMDQLPTHGRTLHPRGDVVLAALESIPVEPVAAKPKRTLWVATVCRNREVFKDYILKIVEPSGSTGFFKLAVALQKPLVGCFLELEEEIKPDLLVSEVGYQRAMAENHDFTFTYVDQKFSYSDDGVWSHESVVHVLTHTSLIGNARIIANGGWHEWEEVVTWFAPVGEGVDESEDEVEPPKDANFEDDVWTRNPWMAHWLAFGDGSAANTAKPTHRKPACANPFEHEVQLEDVMAALDAKRMELGLEGAAHLTPDFQLVLRGGMALYKKTGRYYDGIRVECLSDDAEQFARDFNLKLSFTMDLDLYDESDCRLICTLWSSLMQHWLEAYRHAGEWRAEFLHGFHEEAAVQEAYGRGSPELKLRIEQCRRMRPRSDK